MSLRRTALVRRTQMRRSPMPARKKALATKRVKVSSRRRDTGPTRGVRRVVADRAGYCCELCGLALHDGRTWTEIHSFHHRRPRGMGGSRDATSNTPANLLLLCGTGTSGCHGRIERDRPMAFAYGWLVVQRTDPSLTPVWVWAKPSRPVLLTVDGTYLEEAA